MLFFIFRHISVPVITGIITSLTIKSGTSAKACFSPSSPLAAVTIYRLSASEPQLERQVRAFVWSRESGLAGGRLILAGGEEAPETAALAERLAAQYACVEYRPCAGCRE